MAAKVGSVNVSYGIGVQNRYSAFLEDEDGFGPAKVSSITNVGKQRSSENSAAKPKSLSNGTQKAGSSSTKLNGRAGPGSSNNVKHELQNKGSSQSEAQRMNKGGEQKRPQQQQRQVGNNNNNQVSRPGTNYVKHGNSNQEGNTANNRPSFRNQSNGNYNHQSNTSQQQNNEVNQQQGKPLRNNQRFNNRPRQFHNEDRRVGHQQQQQPTQEGQVDAIGGFGTQSNEEEKRRRQQKRALDLRFKDPEKREARRQQQTANAAPGGEQVANPDNQNGVAQGENSGQRFQRNRRDRNQDDAGRNSKGPRIRNRRQEGDINGTNSGERREGQQNRLPPRDRPQRNRNGFGSGSRNSRNGEDKNQERQIPNFSDKSDFPSLAS